MLRFNDKWRLLLETEPPTRVFKLFPSKLMFTPSDITQWCQRKLPEFIRASLSCDMSFFPLDLPRFGRPDTSLSASDLSKQITLLVEGSLDRIGFGYRVALTPTKTRKHGEQPLPTRVWFERPDDFVATLNLSNRWKGFLDDVHLLLETFPEAKTWVIHAGPRLFEKAPRGFGVPLGAALRTLHERKHATKVFAREIVVPVISGKYIEENLSLIIDALECIHSPAILPAVENHDKLGLLTPPPLIRCMMLDGNKGDAAFPPNAINEYIRRKDVRRILAVENLRTYLTLPTLADTLAIFGSGFAVNHLQSIPNILPLPTFYWGDMDPYGYAILDDVRDAQPNTVSLFMSWQDWLDFAHLASPMPPVDSNRYKHLTEDERRAATEAVESRKGIEQEKIPWGYACSKLASFVAQI